MSKITKGVKKKKGFMDGYKTYNPDVDGYGNATQWQKAFSSRMSIDEANEILDSRDPYFILELKPDASAEMVKSAYRKMAMKYHPDKNTEDSTDKMRNVIAAYTILKKKLKIK